MKPVHLCAVVLTAALPLSALAQDQAVDQAVAVIHPTEGNSAKGTVTFTKAEDGIRIKAQLTGLGQGEHGFHIHEYGDCTSADGKSAGGHFNPKGTPHAGPEDSPRHAGDFGNVTANDGGKGTYDRVDKEISLSGQESIIGHAVVVHAKQDDLTSQPAGDAGDRIGCGVIGIANPGK